MWYLVATMLNGFANARTTSLNEDGLLLKFHDFSWDLIN